MEMDYSKVIVIDNIYEYNAIRNDISDFLSNKYGKHYSFSIIDWVHSDGTATIVVNDVLQKAIDEGLDLSSCTFEQVRFTNLLSECSKKEESTVIVSLWKGIKNTIKRLFA